MTESNKNIVDIPDDVNYVIVEVVNKHEVEQKLVQPSRNIQFKRGLFGGIRTNENTIFLALSKDGVDASMYNLDFIYISVIDYRFGDTKRVWIGEHTEDDQNEAFTILFSLLEKFQKQNRTMLDPELIDLKKLNGYEIEEFILKGDAGGKKDLHWDDDDYGILGGGFGYPSGNNHYNHYDHYKDWNNHNPHSNVYTQPKPEPIFFKRKSKTTKKKLENMKEKVLEIMANKGYIVEEKEEKEQVKEDQTSAGGHYNSDADLSHNIALSDQTPM